MIAILLSSIRSLGPPLANHLWQSTAFAFVIGVLALCVRKNRAQVRYGLWLAASLKFLAPFSLLIGLGSLLPLQRAVVAPQPALYSAASVVAQPFSENVFPVATQVPSLHDRVLAWLPLALAILWLCGALIALLVWYARWREVAAALRKAAPVERGREFEILRRLEHQANLPNRSNLSTRRTIPLLLSRDRREPGIFGIFRPVLLWPEQLSAHLDDEHIEAILTHEMLHARRYDNLTAALHMLVEALFWFHPLVWWMERKLIEERERACDEAVMSMGSKSEAYAEGLLKACRFCVELPLSCVSGITGADLRKRIARIMTASLAESLSGTKQALPAAAVVIAVAVPIVFGQQKQPSAMQAAKTGTNPSLSFEVASVRRDKEDRGGPVRFTDDGFMADAAPLEYLIRNAYNITRDDCVRGLPPWGVSDYYVVSAKVADSDVAEWKTYNADQRRRVLQQFLADRFHLALHPETVELPIYSLVVAKGGLKLQQVTPPAGDPLGFMESKAFGVIVGHHIKIAGLVDVLSRSFFGLDRQVYDNTGLTGNYDFTLTYEPPQPVGANGGTASGPAGRPSIFTALQEELGLKLEPTKGPFDMLVIDHVERPAEN